jgi:hypothetical protein
MTGNDHWSSDQHSHGSPTVPHGQFTAPAEIPEPGVVVPITVWRLDDDDETATDPGAGFASRLARRLVLTYTRQGETVVDFDADQHLRDAATTASRSYLAIARPGELADLDTITDPVSLVIVRWPRQTPSPTAASVADLFTACRLMMSADTCAIAAVSSAEPGQPGTVYAEHLAELLPAARAAGLIHVLQIVAVSRAGDGDQFLYYATRAEADAARRDGQAVPDGPAYHIDLLLFTTSQFPASERDPSTRDRDPNRSRTRRRSSAGHLPEVAEGRGVRASTGPVESSYPPAAVGRPEPLPLNVRIERVVIDGPDAEELPGRTPDSCLPSPRSVPGSTPSEPTGRQRPAGPETPRPQAGSITAGRR